MKFFLKQTTEPGGNLFLIYECKGELLYSVTGEFGMLGGNLYLRDMEQTEIARIHCMGVTGLSKYGVIIGGREQFCVVENFAVSRPHIRLGGTTWRLRGGVMAQSFDVVDVDREVRMTHGRCWSTVGDCFGLEIPREQDIPSCLSIAVIVDSTVMGSKPAPVPAS